MFLEHNGINENWDVLLKYPMEAVWPHADFYLHKSMQLEPVNELSCRLFSKLLDLDYDPFFPDIKLSTRMQFVLMKLLKKIKHWLPQKICDRFNHPTSAITYKDEFEEYQHENIIETLQDERCDTMKRGYAENGIMSRDCLFLTPHFIQHFDFTEEEEIRDYGILRYKFKFACW